jgi:hyperosmotically inducible protein
MKAFLCFLIGIVVGVAGHWLATQPRSTRVVAEAREETYGNNIDQSRSLRESSGAEAIKDELARTGKIIREKARRAGDAIADATANARTTAAIKSKLVQDSGLAAFKIDVDTTDGVVTLSGNVYSHEDIAKAVDLALETDGVHKVVSSLQVKP